MLFMTYLNNLHGLVMAVKHNSEDIINFIENKPDKVNLIKNWIIENINQNFDWNYTDKQLITLLLALYQ